MRLERQSNLADLVSNAVNGAQVVDLHTHLFAPQLTGMNLAGIDELLTYHYLIAEVLRFESVTPEWLLSQPKSVQADLVWQSLFVDRTPLSEAASGVITVLSAFGLDPQSKNLREARAFFSARDPVSHLDEVLRIAGVDHVTMTNDPLDPLERKSWDEKPEIDSRFLSALRIDPILNDWPSSFKSLRSNGYDVSVDLDDQDVAEVRRFLDDWIGKMRPRYLAVSLPDSFSYPEDSQRNCLIRSAVMPTCREHALPFAMMIGVRRQVNRRLAGAGDGVGLADLTAIERLADDHPDNRFLVTTLARENLHGLCVVARKFANVLPFGCWWFMNNPSLVEDTTLMRLEMLGRSFVPQHSDARILEQLIYKWSHARRSIARALTTRYEALEDSGRVITKDDVKRDVTALMSGVASEWLGLTC